MTEGTSQGLFVVVAIVIFGIFVGLTYTLFGSEGLSNDLETIFNDAFSKKPAFDKNADYNVEGVTPNAETDFVFDNVDTIIGYVGTSTEVVIPKTINDKEVTTISGDAFNDKGITKLIMPNSITTIEDGSVSTVTASIDTGNKLATNDVEEDASNKNTFSILFDRNNFIMTVSAAETPINSRIVIGAFANNDIKEISMSANLEYIGSFAFFSGSLEDVILPEGLLEIGASAFEENTLEEIKIPSTVTKLGDNAFKNNELKEVSYGKGSNLTNIGSNVFLGNNIKNLEIPKGTTEIADNAYSNLGLESVKIPEGTKTIGKNAFSNNQLTDVVIPDSVQEIDNGAFKENGLTNIDLPEGLQRIGDYAFYKNKLPIVNLPESLLLVGKYAFTYNELLDVTIPSKLSTIREWTFAYNKMPKKPNIPTNISREESFAFYGNLYKDVDTVTEGDFVFDRLTNTITKYVGTSPNVVIPDTITDLPVEHLGRGSFNSSIKTKLQAVVIPDSVKTIDYETFQNQATLTKVTFGNSIEKIDSYAFQGTSIAEVILPNSLKTIGTQAFSETEYTKRNAIKILDLGNSVEKIGSEAFRYTGLSELKIPVSVKVIEAGAFANISTLKKVYVTSASNSPLPKDPNSGTNKIFSSFPEIIYGQPYIFNTETKSITGYLGTQTNIIIPDKIDGVVVENIGDNAFDRLQGQYSKNIFVDLTSVKLSNNIKTIGSQAFAGNGKLTNLDLGYSVVTLGTSSFEKTALSEVTIPNSVVTIGMNAFKDNDSFPQRLLKKVTFGNSVEKIGMYAFGYTGLEEIVIPKSVKLIEQYAFSQASSLKKVMIQNSKNNITISSSAFYGVSGLTPIYTE